MIYAIMRTRVKVYLHLGLVEYLRLRSLSYVLNRPLALFLLTAREGNVFRGVCHSVHRGSPSSPPTPIPPRVGTAI